MKKIFAFFLGILLCVGVFTACGPLMHEHIAGQWEFNKSQHWQPITCTWNLCKINIVSEDHIDDDADGICDICGYLPLLIGINGQWHYSDTHHWQTPEGDAVFTPVYGYGTHIDEDTNRKCDICGYLMLEPIVIEWQYNDTHHWLSEGDFFEYTILLSPHIDEDINGICDTCGYEGTIKEQLTLDKVIELSAKGELLTWGDFDQYISRDIGSGICVRLYEIDEDFVLLVGGSGAPEDSPIYIRLALNGNIDNYIDIRTGAVKAFIEANKK